MNILNDIIYHCPYCRTQLHRKLDVYVCPICANAYPIIQSIPVFSDFSTYHGEIERERMHLLIEQAEQYGYKQALKNYIADPFIYTYASDEDRARWMEILHLHSDTVFLDVGCGWGTTTIPISKRVKWVVALDATYERVKFVQIRSAQSGAENIIPVSASAIKLPFPSDYFDIVAFNGVLEWLGAIDKTSDPRKFQIQALAEAHRVLKPGGSVYIGIENRYSLRYILGDPDDHSFLRFTSLMPRRLANIYCKFRKGEPYYTFTYSLQKYKGMLTETHFAGTECYLPWPNYRNPDEIVPLSKRATLDLLRRISTSVKFGRKWLYIKLLYLLTSIEANGNLFHSFCFISHKERE